MNLEFDRVGPYQTAIVLKRSDPFKHMGKKIYRIQGMHCVSCASMIELDFEDAGIKASCSYPKEELAIEGSHDSKKVVEILKKSGYSLTE